MATSNVGGYLNSAVPLKNAPIEILRVPLPSGRMKAVTNISIILYIFMRCEVSVVDKISASGGVDMPL